MVCCHNSDMLHCPKHPTSSIVGMLTLIFSANHLCKNQRKCLDGTIKPLSGTNAISWYQKLPKETCFFAVRFWDSDFTSKYTREGWKRVSMLQYLNQQLILAILSSVQLSASRRIASTPIFLTTFVKGYGIRYFVWTIDYFDVADQTSYP